MPKAARVTAPKMSQNWRFLKSSMTTDYMSKPQRVWAGCGYAPRSEDFKEFKELKDQILAILIFRFDIIIHRLTYLAQAGNPYRPNNVWYNAGVLRR